MSTSNTSSLPLFEEEPLCVHHESPSALRVSTFLDDYISDLDNAQIEEEKSASKKRSLVLSSPSST